MFLGVARRLELSPCNTESMYDQGAQLQLMVNYIAGMPNPLDEACTIERIINFNTLCSYSTATINVLNNVYSSIAFAWFVYSYAESPCLSTALVYDLHLRQTSVTCNSGTG